MEQLENGGSYHNPFDAMTEIKTDITFTIGRKTFTEEYVRLICPYCIEKGHHKIQGVSYDVLDCKNLFTYPDGTEGQCCCWCAKHGRQTK